MQGIPQHLIDRVFLGDVFDLLRQLPDKSVDMVYSDPDYNVGVKYNDRSYTRSFEEYLEWYIELARESLRVLKDDGNMFFINYPKQNAYLRVHFFRRCLPRCTGLCVDLQHEYRTQLEAVHNRASEHSPL